jgi:hypothetical protein
MWYVQLVSCVLLYVESKLGSIAIPPRPSLSGSRSAVYPQPLTVFKDDIRMLAVLSGTIFTFTYVGHCPLSEVYLIDMTYQELK